MATTTRPQFQSRHYWKIAEILRSAINAGTTYPQLVDRFATVFQLDNPNFDWDKFHDAVYRA